MIIPSIDIVDGDAVQLIGGEEPALNAGDPRPLAEKFGRVGEVAVIDLDAAKGEGSNAETIRQLLPLARCRVGGGIRTVEKAIEWLDAGAESVILGTAARPEILKQLPRDRVWAALDARHGEVVVEGWRKKTGATVVERMEELREYVAGFLVTFVETEGRLQGIDLGAAQTLYEAAGGCGLTVAGGVSSVEEVGALDDLGIDAQVGMALYTGRFTIGEAVAATLESDRPDGLWPTVVQSSSGLPLGLAYSNLESLEAAVTSGEGVYWSRKRGLWRKGATSGNTQRLLSVDVDCDRDTLRFVVEQTGPFCHRETTTCWGHPNGLLALEETIRGRLGGDDAASYTRRLAEEPELLASKIREEAEELIAADTAEEVTWEAADLIYFAMVKMATAGVSLADVQTELDRRAKVVTRRSQKEKS
jgi:phosphoribosyl-ATP pyrophosphohydrolase